MGGAGISGSPVQRIPKTVCRRGSFWGLWAALAKIKTDTLQKIELAEGVEIRLRTAGPFVRAVAWLTDLAIQLSVLLIVALLVGLLFSGLGANVTTGVTFILLFILF